MIRVFLLTGSYVDVQDMSLAELEEFLRMGKPFRATGKIGETLSIRPEAVAYAARYKD